MHADLRRLPGLPSRLLSRVLCLAAAVLLPAFAHAATTEIMAFKDVSPGMKGTGRTVFKGTTVEEFSVEILGTMENILPKKNLILARLDGGPLRDTGIMEGMSGSPVYINGKLIGAVAYSWGFAKEPICGITPIEEMLSILDRGLDLPAAPPTGPPGTNPAPSPGSPRSAPPAPATLLLYPDRMVDFLRSWQHGVLPAPAAASGVRPLRPTLAFSGYDPDVAREWFPGFESMSLSPVMAGSPGSLPSGEGKDTTLSAGSAFGVALVRGDLDITAVGTVTYVDGDKVLGFGHPMLAMGSTAMPMTRAWVHGLFPSLMSSFKLASPLNEVGAITQDRFPGVGGRKGASVKMVPVRIEMKRPDGTPRSFRFDIVPDPLLTPGLLHVSLLSLLSGEEKGVGDASLRLREGSRIQLGDGLDVKLDNLFSGESAPLYASGTVAYMTYLLLNNEDRSARIEGINLFVDYEDQRRLARVDHIRLERSTARPGETINMEVELQPYRAEPITVEIPLKIPEEAAEGKALLQVGDSLTLSRMEAVGGSPYFVPRSLEHLVWLLNHLRASNKVYATLIRPDTGAFIDGQRLPNLPPSVSTVLLPPITDMDHTSRVRFRSLLEAEAETTLVVRGYQKMVLEIRR